MKSEKQIYLLILFLASYSACNNNLLTPKMDSSKKVGLVPTSQPIDIPTLFSYSGLVRDAVISKNGEVPKNSKNFETTKTLNSDDFKSNANQFVFKDSLQPEFLRISDGKVALFNSIDEQKNPIEFKIVGDVKVSKIVYLGDTLKPTAVIITEEI